MSVNIIRNKRRKRVAFFVTPDGIELRVPARLPKRIIDVILSDHADWIQEQLKSLPRREMQPEDTFLYRGESFPLVRDGRTTFDFDGEAFYCPEQWSKSDLFVAYEHWLRERALEYVKERAPYYERLLGVEAKRIRIGHQKSRWGSCSSQGNISINVRLMLAPVYVMDYVIAHEWTHLVHFDHSKSFWSTLRSVYPATTEVMNWLKENGHTLHIQTAE